MTTEQYDALLTAQYGLCAICGQPGEEPKARATSRQRAPRAYAQTLTVDHDHETGAVRGLLCFNCNFGLGRWQESIEVMQAAIEYLKRHNAERHVAA